MAEERELLPSASGRLLIAHLDWRARRRLVTAIGGPDAQRWPGIAACAELNGECAALRKTGVEINRPRSGVMNAVAVAIPDGSGGTAVLALGMPKRGWNEDFALRSAREAAVRITRGLCSPMTVASAMPTVRRGSRGVPVR